MQSVVFASLVSKNGQCDECGCEEVLSCQVATLKPSHEPLRLTLLPSGPWQEVNINFCEVAGH